MIKSTYTTEYQKLLAKIISARKAKGMTQAALGVLLGKPQSFVSKIESGERRLDVMEFLEISRHIGMSVMDVLDI